MYFCRRFLGLVLTGLFVASLFASADGPKELNKYNRSNSQQPKVLVKTLPEATVKAVRALPEVSVRGTRTLPEVNQTYRALPNIEVQQTSRPGCDDCEFDFTNYGSECCDTAWDEYGIDCATLEANYSWDCSGCLCPGDGPAECGDGNCTGDETYETCPEDCNAPGECDEGYIIDCADDDCCPESWIGDGFEDCEDQAYGCDLTCYDNDGGDCGTRSGNHGFKSMTQSLRSGHRVVAEMHTAKEGAIALKDGVVVNSDNAVRMGEAIFANESREVVATVAFECLAGTNAGYVGSWDTDPSGGEFTVYGWGADDVIVASLTFCDGGACSETVGNFDDPVNAGDEASQWCGEAGCENAMGDVTMTEQLMF